MCECGCWWSGFSPSVLAMSSCQQARMTMRLTNLYTYTWLQISPSYQVIFGCNLRLNSMILKKICLWNESYFSKSYNPLYSVCFKYFQDQVLFFFILEQHLQPVIFFLVLKQGNSLLGNALLTEPVACFKKMQILGFDSCGQKLLNNSDNQRDIKDKHKHLMQFFQMYLCQILDIFTSLRSF